MDNNTLVFSIATGNYSSLFEECLNSQKKYCAKHGFHYSLVNKSPDTLLPAQAAWLKIYLLKEALKCKYNRVGFIDADCEIREHAPSFIKYIEERKDKSIFMCKGFSGRLNSGVIFMKNTPESMEFLETLIENSEKPVPEADKAPYENGHVIHYGKNNPDIDILDSQEWNNNRVLDEKSFIQHYSGGILREEFLRSHPLARKKFLFKKKLDQLIFRLFRKNITKTRDLKDLLPEFKKKYPEFSCKVQ